MQPLPRITGAFLLLVACSSEGSRTPPAPAGSGLAGGGGAAPASSGAGGGVSGSPASGGVSAGGSLADSGGAGVSVAGGGAGGDPIELSAGAGGAEAAGAGGVEQEGACAATWPEAQGSVILAEPLAIAGSFDGGLERYVGPADSGGQGEDQAPLFVLEDGASLENVVIGAPAADGIHCLGSCTLRNVWWEDVGEDAATLKGESPSQVMLVECGGARLAEDKIFQHNGPGKVIIRRFAADGFGKLYRSCGNCSEMYERHVELEHIVAQNGDALVGINTNYGDTARFSNVVVRGSAEDTDVCQRYEGNDQGDEPELLGSGPDAEHCLFGPADVTFE